MIRKIGIIVRIRASCFVLRASWFKLIEARCTMHNARIWKHGGLLSLILMLLFFSIISPKNSYAAIDYGAGRTRTCTVSGKNVTVEGLDFNPTDGGKDIEFVMSNPVCLTVAITSYAAVKVAIAIMNNTCGTGSAIRIAPSPLLDLVDIAKSTAKAGVNGACWGAIAGTGGAMGIALGQLGIIYGIATGVYSNTKICGAEWLKPDPVTYNISAYDYKQTIKLWVEGKMANGSVTTSDQKYREWFYGGVEVEDNPDDEEPCRDPTGGENSKINGQYPIQKYYLKGTPTGNFSCEKYFYPEGRALNGVDFDTMRNAYNCCLRRSQEYICIDYSGNKLFCKAGSICNISGIYFTARSLDEGRMLCAESYSLCPYNFTIGGGSEYCDYYRDGTWNSSQGRWIMITKEQIDASDCASNSEIRNADCTFSNKAGKCKNYCQYLRHCTITSEKGFSYVSSLSSAYFAEACMNFEGDSQNKTAAPGGFLIGSQKHFSAPIAQCMKETLENVFYNRAGHSKCLNYNEAPSANGVCPSGLYAMTSNNFLHKKGEKVKLVSFFTMLQDALQFFVKLVLTLSITFYGMNILLFKTSLGNKKEILTYILKIGLVMYFATGDAWQSTFFNSVYGASSEFAMMVFKIETMQEPNKRDGCQFGRISLPDGSEQVATTYPAGKEYLAIWDTLDCKIMRYLGFGPEASAANIVMLILAGYFTGAVGVYFSLSLMIFGLLLIAATIRALHIFLASCLSIIIMVFVSPIIIPLTLFEKTKSIFDNWLKELISFVLQPMILFAYIAIFVTIMDKTMIGSANFFGDPPSKTIDCQERCVSDSGILVNNDSDLNNDDIDCQENRLINPLNDSVACLIGVSAYKSHPALQMIGIPIPMIANLLSSNIKERVLTILKGALVMYLIYKFMDQIPGIASNLTGGSGLPQSKADGVKMFKAIAGGTAEIQKRLSRGALNAGKNAAGKLRDGAKDMAKTAGDKGKSVSDAIRPGGEDSPQGEEKSGTDSAQGEENNGTDSSQKE